MFTVLQIPVMKPVSVGLPFWEPFYNWKLLLEYVTMRVV